MRNGTDLSHAPSLSSQIRFTELAESEVRSETDALLYVHHATRNWSFPVEDLAPFTHFGTRQAARQRMFEWSGARLISGFLDIRRPLYLPDLNANHDLGRLLGLIASSEAGVDFPPDLRAQILQHEQNTGEGLDLLAEKLREAGYDGIGYRNHHEDPGSMSWICLSASQFLLVSDGPIEHSRDPWEYDDPDAFTGPSLVLPVFGIDGRCGNYDHLWEALAEDGQRLPDLARSPEGWTVRWLFDWDPPATMGLLAPDGSPRGFYMGGQLWIDREARGQGLSKLLIRAAADLLGGPPAQNPDGMGFSPAGHAAHVSAWRAAREAAREAGYLDLAENDLQP